MVITGDVAYVADRNWGLWILATADPAAPALLGAHLPFGLAMSVAVAGDYAHIAAGDFGLRVVDVTNPARPVEVAAIPTDTYANDVVVDGHTLYGVSLGWQGLYIVDVRDPAHPVLASGFFCRPMPLVAT